LLIWSKTSGGALCSARAVAVRVWPFTKPS
jgi:hypothetical protein